MLLALHQLFGGYTPPPPAPATRGTGGVRKRGRKETVIFTGQNWNVYESTLPEITEAQRKLQRQNAALTILLQ